jgi:hypothetical protein
VVMNDKVCACINNTPRNCKVKYRSVYLRCLRKNLESDLSCTLCYKVSRLVEYSPLHGDFQFCICDVCVKGKVNFSMCSNKD